MYRKILNWLLKKVDLWISKLLKFKTFITYSLYMNDFGYEKSDIYVVTYPRSGTTLLQMILHQMFSDGSLNFNHINDISPWIRNDVYEGISANKNLKKPRVIKSHDPYIEFDQQVCGKIIFVLRDGLDAMYSLYKQKVDYGNPDLSLDKFSENLIKNNTTKWYEFNKPWLLNSKKREILFLTYNELVNNKRETIIKICNFLNVDIHTIDIKRVMENSSLKFMKNHQKLFGERNSKSNKNFNYTNFIRKGGFGDGKKRFNSNITNSYNLELKKLEHLLKKNNLEL